MRVDEDIEPSRAGVFDEMNSVFTGSLSCAIFKAAHVGQVTARLKGRERTLLGDLFPYTTSSNLKHHPPNWYPIGTSACR